MRWHGKPWISRNSGCGLLWRLPKARRDYDLCVQSLVSPGLGYLWLRRYQEFGVRGIAERSRRPHRSPRRTADSLEQRVVEMRLRYPGWGSTEAKRAVAPRSEGRCRTARAIHAGRAGFRCRFTICCEADQLLDAQQLRCVLNEYSRMSCGRMDFTGRRGGRVGCRPAYPCSTITAATPEPVLRRQRH